MSGADAQCVPQSVNIAKSEPFAVAERLTKSESIAIGITIGDATHSD
jgi:hypothetical protein